ncbi:MAG TPA: ethanolamine ammonia lyase-activating protein [Chloroflexota bacterium]
MEGGGDIGWGQRDRPTPYQIWQKEEGLPINKGAFVQSLHKLDVADWPRMGQKGAFVNLAGQEHDDGYVLEIAPGGQTEVQHHLFEATVCVISGRGATTLWHPGATEKQTIEWQRGTVFAPPLNCYYQHFNLDGQRPARLWAMTNAPMVINLFRSPDLVFNCPYEPRDRYNMEEDYFTARGEKIARSQWRTNYIADVRTFELDHSPTRGANSYLTSFVMSNNSMAVHIAEWSSGTYLKAHRHNVGAHLLHLEGKGYSLLWYEGQEKDLVKVDWEEGTVFSPREMEFHQHFNTGPGISRHIAFRLGDLDIRVEKLGFGYDFWQELQGIPYECEDPSIYETYEAECKKNGAVPTLPRPDYTTCSEEKFLRMRAPAGARG